MKKALLEGCTRKKHVHEKLAAGMTEARYEGRGVECGAGTRLPEEEIH